MLEQKLATLTARLRYEASAIGVYAALRALELHYRADQPRVPAGNPEGGQWTSVGGSPANATDDRIAEVIYVCVRVGSVPITDETGSLAYAVSYLCGFDNELVSWTSRKRLKAIIPDPRF